MKSVTTRDLVAWLGESRDLSRLVRSIGAKRASDEFLDTALGVPLHLRFAIEARAAEEAGPLPADAFDSIPFYSLCRGLYLPLSGMTPERAANLFGIVVPPPPSSDERRELVLRFLDKAIGLSLVEKMGALLGDPFQGRRSGVRQGTLFELLASVQMTSRSKLLDRLARFGDIAILFAERTSAIRSDPPLTAREVLESLRLVPGAKRKSRLAVLRSLLVRMGKLEAFFLVRLCLRRAGFGFEYQGTALAEALATRFGAAPDLVAHAMALTDPFQVARILTTEGPAGLARIQLAPLVAVRPALASGTVEEVERFPVWVERKYDGIRLLLHKATDRLGSVLCAAYTRNRHDWIELVPALEGAIRMLPARAAIVDGELYGTVIDVELGTRPATVYEVHTMIQGAPIVPVQLRFAAFDLLHLDGADLTPFPLEERRRRLAFLVGPFAAFPLPIPVSLAVGQLAQTKEDVTRLYQHFRSQGYEGIVTKDLQGPYRIATRDPAWKKRKPAITLDLVLLAAVYAVTTKEKAGLFGSYVIGARRADGSFEDVGDVAGVDRVRDAEIQAQIAREGLLTGRRIERAGATGLRAGLELAPGIVVTVRFEGVIRDSPTAKHSLRDPKIVGTRPDKTPAEADTMDSICHLHLAERIG